MLQKPPSNAHTDVSRGARGLYLFLRLLLLPYFVYVRSKGSGTGWSEPSLLANVISTKVLSAGPYVVGT